MTLLTMGKTPKPVINKENNTRQCRECKVFKPQTNEFWYVKNGKVKGNFCKICSVERQSPAKKGIDDWRVYKDPYFY